MRDHRKNNSAGSLLGGLLVGVVAGAAAMMFMDEKKKKQLKLNMSKALKEGKKKVDETKMVDVASKKVSEILEKVKKASQG